MNKEWKAFFVREYVIAFGFLSGYCIHIGLDLEGAWLRPLLSLGSFDTLYINVFLALLSLVAIGSGIILSYRQGGKLGLFAVGLAFFGGLLIESSLGVYSLLSGIVIAYYLEDIKREIKKIKKWHLKIGIVALAALLLFFLWPKPKVDFFDSLLGWAIFGIEVGINYKVTKILLLEIDKSTLFPE